MYKIIIVKQINSKLISEWKQLWKRAENANIFNSYEWFATNLELNRNIVYELHLCYQKEKLVALLPLQKDTYFGVGVWRTLSKDHLLDTAFLMENYNKELFTIFFQNIIEQKNIFLQKTDKEATYLLKSIFPKLFISLMSVNPTVILKEDAFAHTSPSTIAQIKKVIRKNPGQLRFEMYNNNLQKHMRTMFTLQKKSSKNARSMDIFENPAIKKYYQVMTKNCADFVRICFLYLNEVPIAYQYGFLYRDIFVGDQIAYRNEYNKLRPGKTILYFLLEELKKQEVKMFDLGGGISMYKMEFTDEYRILYNIFYSNNQFVMFWWKAINKARRINQQLFPKKFTRDNEFLFKSL